MPDLNTINEFNRQIEILQDSLNNIVKVLNNDMLKKLQDNVTEANNFVDAIQRGKNVTEKLSSKLTALQKEANRNSSMQAKLEKLIEDAKRKGNKAVEERLRISQFQQRAYQKQIEQQQTIYTQLLNTNKEQQKQKDVSGSILRAFEKNLGVTKAQVKEMFGLTGLFTLLVDSAFKADRQATELAKSLGVSKIEAMGIREEFVTYARASEDNFVTTDRLLKAQQGLTEQLGIAVKYSGQEVEQFARLTEIVGLTNEEAGKLAQFSVVSGKSTKDYVADLRKGAFFAQQANKVRISDKELLSTISKLSAGILVKFQNNPKALAEAVIQAKKLGLNLEQVDSIGKSMLDWESSIENELEAELITGKKLNFERARAAALTGDQATLMQEVASQAGSLAEFESMNVIARESLAKAFGMNADQMAEMLMKQEAINKYGDKASELNAEQLKDMEKRNMTVDQYLAMQDKQQTAQDKFNQAIEKLQDIVSNLVAGPFGMLLDILANILGVIGKIVAGVQSLFGSGIAKTLVGAVAGFAVGGPVGALIGGVGGAISGMMADDMVGYGARTLLTPGGAVALNNNDTIIAGTNLFKGDDTVSFPKGALSLGGSSPGVIEAISNLTNMIAKAPAPQFALNVDGQRLGSVVGRQSETGTQQSQNAYRLA